MATPLRMSINVASSRGARSGWFLFQCPDAVFKIFQRAYYLINGLSRETDLFMVNFAPRLLLEVMKFFSQLT
jgi:hypothetical protein